MSLEWESHRCYILQAKKCSHRVLESCGESRGEPSGESRGESRRSVGFDSFNVWVVYFDVFAAGRRIEKFLRAVAAVVGFLLCVFNLV